MSEEDSAIRPGPSDPPAAASAAGRVALVGAGPGDPGLMTLRGRELLGQADAVVYDYLCNPALLRFAPEGAEMIYAGKKAGAHTLRQEEINALLVRLAREGKRVVRLKGGDPFLFGRGGEEALALREAGVAFEIVPGVTSAIGGPAYAGIPVTHRGLASAVTIATGHEDPGKGGRQVDYEALARTPGTLVLLMGVERLGPILAGLARAGMDPRTPAALVRWAATPRQRVLVSTVAELAAEAEAAGFTAPCVTVIGEVVRLRDRLAWYAPGPLAGVRAVVTRTRKQAGRLSEALRLLGAEVDELPTIRIAPPEDERGFAELVAQAHRYDWLVFPSPNAADAFFEVFYKIYKDARELGGVRIASMGPATTARVAAYRFTVDLEPKEFVAEGLLRAFEEYGSVENLTFLVPRAEGGRDVLIEGLKAKGAIVDDVTAYRTLPERNDATGAARRFREGGADLITFTSSSTVENFLAMGLRPGSGTRVASIGPVTSRTLRAAGIEPAIEAARHDIEGLVAAVLDFYTKNPPELG